MPESSKRRTAAEILAFLDERKTRSAVSESAGKRLRYQQAAAVLAALRRPDQLQPVGGDGKPGEGAQLLGADLIPVVGRKLEGVRMLRPESRRAAIAQLRTPADREKALAANPEERSGTVQRQLERYLLHKALPLAEQPPQQLDETWQVVTWLEGVLDNLPPISAVNARIREAALMAGFEALAGDDIFRGRRTELDELRNYIGVLEPVALLNRLKERALRWTRPDAQPALSISGPGGIGKSALIARFLLEHSRLPREARIPFAYLDFDRPALNISQPGTLLAEMLRQIDTQFSEEGHFRRLRKFFEDEMGAGQRSPEPEADEGQEYDARILSVIADLVGLIDQFLGPRPYVIVLDTFEEVQYRGEHRAYPFWELLDRMQRARPFLRVVLSGRAPVTTLQLAGKPAWELNLGDLDREAAEAFVRAQGVSDPEAARALVKHVGGVPLSLKLAASMMKRGGAEADWVQNIQGKSWFWFSASDEVIQGQLYTRILGHLHDPALESLAHPGLVLRRITPQLILEVLKEPCHLPISTLEEAADLFNKLRRETSLVSSDELDGSLVHRPDLRRVMLRLLVEKSPDAVERIHRNAVAFYKKQSGWRAKVEELYHRLQLGEPDLDDKMIVHPDVQSSLQSSISELPLSSQRFLATWGYQVAEDVLESATREEREASLAAQVEELLPFGRGAVEEAERLVMEEASKMDHPSPLFYAAGRVLAQRGEDGKAAEYYERGLRQGFEGRQPTLVLNLLREKAWLLRRAPQLGDLGETLEALGEQARRFDRPTALFQHAVQSYEVDPAPPLLKEVAAHLSHMTPDDLWNVFPLLEKVVQPLATAEPATATRLAKLITTPDGVFQRVENWEIQSGVEKIFSLVAEAELKRTPGSRLTGMAVLVDEIAKICRGWPFRVLSVRPPYSTASLESMRLE